MSSPITNAIYPCPFSKGYGIPSNQAWILLSVFSLYRFTLACLFVVLFFSPFGPNLLGSYNPELYINISLSYLITTIFFGVCALLRNPGYATQAQSIIFIDITAITLLMHASGGIISGIGMLLAVTIAAGGLLIGGRCAMLFAALASLAILTEQIYASEIKAFASTAYTYAGVLGAAFFTIALLSYFLALRSEQSQRIISQKQQTILKLEDLNQHIIQQLNSGIIISDSEQTISLVNEAALKLLNLATIPATLTDISDHLVSCFQDWRTNHNFDLATLNSGPDNEIHLRFITLNTEQKTFYMIILEDSALYNQRLQLSKLASLGQLTASIAHEIRNPLSALNHASQLLAESQGMNQQELRLTEIIETNTARVNKIIEDILQLSHRRASNRQKFLLGDWLDDYLQTFTSTSEPDKQLKFITNNELDYVFIDPDHLKQILDNLCHNALKYGRQKDGQVLVKVHRDHQSLCLDVIDNGPGISSDQRQHLFEPFYTTSATGTGLGLYLSKELAELNQASLSYHANATGGSCFRVRLSGADHNPIEI